MLAAAAAPDQAAEFTRVPLRSLLKKAGRQRGIEAGVERLRDALRIPHMRRPSQVEQAVGRQAIALLRQLDAARTSVEDLTAFPATPTPQLTVAA
ncbi:hypothetical protein ACF07S_28045 [Streptomyces sp. NPDC016640]|uniref:hypothetical protein n=1 Tax=Streptomyces sp. NPDC016640 TaxID=3364969 RepID=UPI0036FB881E